MRTKKKAARAAKSRLRYGGRIMKRTASLLVALFVALTGFARCASPEDPGLAWLLGAAAGAPAAEGPIGDDYVINVNDVVGSPDFVFASTVTIDLHVTVLDPVAPVSGTVVQFRELSGSRTGRVLFHAVTGSTGNVTGNFTVDTTSNMVRLIVTYNQQTYTFDISITGLLMIDRTLFLTAQVAPVQIVDSDGDGIPDELDTFPTDPTRSTTVRFPGEGHLTIAFEDLFPNQGDADFNDFVIQAVHEEDLNSSGSIARIRANYTHVAKGAGYNHTLHTNIALVGGVVTIKRYHPDGALVSDTTEHYASLQNIALLPSSNTTIPQSNTAKSQTFQAGDRFEIEIVPDSAVTRAAAGAPPYDLYLYVLNTKKEIHFAGKHFNADGSDRFLDATGFPWALSVPGNWRWMYEKGNIHAAYPSFGDWYGSAGVNNQDWYNFAVDSLVVSY